MSPAVVVVDESVLGPDGIAGLPAIVAATPQSAFIVVGMHDHPAYVARAREAGAADYVRLDDADRLGRAVVEASAPSSAPPILRYAPDDVEPSACDRWTMPAATDVATHALRHDHVPRRAQVISLVKRFGDHVALDDCSLTARPGRVLGLLGPNGPGKTTAMRCVFGLVAPDRGVVRWKGEPVDRSARLRFGYMPEERGLYPQMRIRAQLEYLAQLSGLDRRAAAAGVPALARPARTCRPRRGLAANRRADPASPGAVYSGALLRTGERPSVRDVWAAARSS